MKRYLLTKNDSDAKASESQPEKDKTLNKITMKTIKANREKFVLCGWCGAEYDPFKSAVLDAAITLSNGKARASKPVIKAIREFGFPIYNKRKG